MSQYLSFELVNKANPEIKVDLGYWCTSIARGITYNFNNIFEYKQFIEDVDNVKIETFEFNLVHIKDGIYGIKLDSVFTGGSTIKNELCADLQVVIGDVAVVTIPAYSGSQSNGFRLTTSSKESSLLLRNVIAIPNSSLPSLV